MSAGKCTTVARNVRPGHGLEGPQAHVPSLHHQGDSWRGEGRGLFATPKIKPGQIILEEYPLLSLSGIDDLSNNEFRTNHYPNVDKEIKAKILEFHDPAENIKTLEIERLRLSRRWLVRNPS